MHNKCKSHKQLSANDKWGDKSQMYHQLEVHESSDEEKINFRCIQSGKCNFCLKIFNKEAKDISITRKAIFRSRVIAEVSIQRLSLHI